MSEQVGEVQEQFYMAGHKGWGFVIMESATGFGGRPACAVTFKTKDEADIARAAVAEALRGALNVTRS